MEVLRVGMNSDTDEMTATREAFQKEIGIDFFFHIYVAYLCNNVLSGSTFSLKNKFCI